MRELVAKGTESKSLKGFQPRNWPASSTGIQIRTGVKMEQGSHRGFACIPGKLKSGSGWTASVEKFSCFLCTGRNLPCTGRWGLTCLLLGSSTELQSKTVR